MEFGKLKVTELRKQLGDLGLDTTGLKADLVERLTSYTSKRQRQPMPANDDDLEDDEEDEDYNDEDYTDSSSDDGDEDDSEEDDDDLPAAESRLDDS